MKHAHRTFNSQPYVIQLQDAGFNPKQSQALLSVIEQQQLMKHDMDQLESKFDKFQFDVTHEFKEVRRDIKELRQEVRRDIKELQTEFKTENQQLATGLLIKLGALMVLLLTLFSGLLGLFIKFLH